VDVLVCRRRHLKRRSQTTDPLYSTSRFDDEDSLDRQQVPDSVIYVSTHSPLKDAPPPSLCSYHRYFRSRTGSGNDAMWRADRTPIYVASAGDTETGQTSFPLLVHPASTLATPHFRSAAMTSSPEVARRRATSFRSADNLDSSVDSPSAGGNISKSPRQRIRADVGESIRRKRPLRMADRQEEPSETENLCSCDHPATIDCSWINPFRLMRRQ